MDRDRAASRTGPPDDRSDAPTLVAVLAIVAATFALVSVQAAVAEPITSTFDAEPDAWTVIDEPTGEVYLPDHLDEGGNPGGHVAADSDPAEGTWYWSAPDEYLGNVSAHHGSVLSFDLKQNRTEEQYGTSDVLLHGEEVTIVWHFDGASAFPGTDWTSYEVPIDDGEGWVRQDDGEPVTADELDGILTSLTGLWIRGEYAFAPNRGGLDNVRLGPQEDGTDGDDGGDDEDTGGGTGEDPGYGTELPVTVPIEPHATYLRTFDEATDAEPVDLARLGVEPGDRIRLTRLGSWDAEAGAGLGLTVVFSSTAELLPADEAHRVPGAVDAGEDVGTPPTYHDGMPTDIPEDLRVADGTGEQTNVTVVVPPDAAYLFASPLDDLFEDNADPTGDLALEIAGVEIPDEDLEEDDGAGDGPPDQPLGATVSLRDPLRVSPLPHEIRPYQPGIKFGGRTVAVSVDPSSSGGKTALAASESGGLFRTTDGGTSWTHVDGVYPHRLEDVAHAPSDPSVVLLTGDPDSRKLGVLPPISGGGIWRSADGGRTWERPASAEPPGDCGTTLQDYPHGRLPVRGYATARSIAFEPGTSNAYVATDCGLAVSSDLGRTWSHVPVNGTHTKTVSVVSPAKGIVDVCTKEGRRTGDHHRYRPSASDPTQGRWSGDNLGIGCRVNAPHALAAAPTNPSFLFAFVQVGDEDCEDAVRRVLHVSEDGGGSWEKTDLAPCQENRIPFVSTSTGVDGQGRFLVFAGDGVDVYRRRCDATVSKDPCSSGQASSSWKKVKVGHADPAEVAFPPGSFCPAYMADDGGVEGTEDCGVTWSIVGNTTNGYHALQAYGIWGQSYPDHTDLYIGTQDNSIWASPDTGKTWTNPICCELGFLQLDPFVLAHDPQVVTGVKAFPSEGFQSGPHFENQKPWNRPPDTTCCVPYRIEAGTYVQWNKSRALHLTKDTGKTWSDDPLVTVPRAKPLSTKVVGPSNDPDLFVTAGRAGSGLDLVKVEDLLTSNDPSPVKVTPPSGVGIHKRGEGTFHFKTVFGVLDDTPPYGLIASNADGKILVSDDGGKTWTKDQDLTDVLTAHGRFLDEWGIPSKDYQSQASEITFVTGSLLDRRLLPAWVPLIGTEANGIVTSFDGGQTWGRIPGSRQVPAVSGMFYDRTNEDLYVSSYGRGLWRVDDLDTLAPTERGLDDQEPDDDPQSAADLDGLGKGSGTFNHDHLQPGNAVQDASWTGRTFERWTWTTPKRTLHDQTDVDWVSVPLPDPSQSGGGHPGIPECKKIDRDRRGVEGALFVGGVLHVDLKVLPQATGVPRPDDDVKVYDADTGKQLTSLSCPRQNGHDELLISYGERNDRRGVFHDYKLNVTYEIEVVWMRDDVQRIIDKGRKVREAAGAPTLDRMRCMDVSGGGTGPGGIGSRFSFHDDGPSGGTFPYCEGGTSGFRHPVPWGAGENECPPEAICRSFRRFAWQDESRFAAEILTEEDVGISILDDRGKEVAEAVAVGDAAAQPGDWGGLFEEEADRIAGDGEPVSEGDAPTGDGGTDFAGRPAGGHGHARTTVPSHAVTFQNDDEPGSDDASGEGALTLKRLVVPDLAPGVYFLQVEGPPTDVRMQHRVPPPPTDSDGDGVSDFYDVESAGLAGIGEVVAPVGIFALGAAVGVGGLLLHRRWRTGRAGR